LQRDGKSLSVPYITGDNVARNICDNLVSAVT
jgi:hypothetical protein